MNAQIVDCLIKAISEIHELDTAKNLNPEECLVIVVNPGSLAVAHS